MEIFLKALTSDSLKDFRSLLGSNEFGGCFCAVWTSHGDDWEKRCKDKTQPNFFITKSDLEKGRHVGFLVYSGNDLIGWTGSGPKTSFPFLKAKLGSRISPYSTDTWSVGCLAVKKKYRGNGVSDFIVNAIIDEARANGAASVEAYPVRPFHEPRIFRGTHQLYVRLGFQECGSEKDGEHEVVLMQLPLQDMGA